MDNANQKSDIIKNSKKKSLEDYSPIVEEIKTYVDSLGDNESNFIFGNIAFSHDGEDKINIGSRLEYGNKSIETWKDLSLENKNFGAQLNAQQCFSITKYLKNKEIKILSLSFEEQWKELVLIPFDKNKKIKAIKYFDENDLQTDMFGEYKPCYYDDYPVPQGKDEQYAIVAFRKTLKYYNSFHKIVESHNSKIQKGYIYLIRPKKDLGGGFAALAYMFLKKSLDYKDLEIISQKLSLYFLDVLKKKAEVESIKSAKAAIMSRNMSHNLGSHVMSYIKQQLANEETLLGDTGVAIEDNIKGIINANAGIHKEFPFLIGLGRFIGYLQERQDYIATISTDYIPYGAPVNMKDAIYDELNPDLKYFRHKNDSSESKRNRPANILLNYIAKSEGLAREYISESTTNVKNDIRFGYICYDETGVSHTFYGLNGNDGKEDPALAEMRKINFSLPGGLVGRQAVFSIIENLIRNAAKHGNKTGMANLDFVFDVIDGAHIGSARNRICDEKWCSLYQNASDIKDLYILTITNNLNETKKTVETLRDKGLIDPFIGDDGRMNTANKGIKEIRISAAWIRGNTDEDAYYKYSDNTESAKLAPLVAVELAEGKHLRYAICIPKQKVVAIVPEVTVGEKTYVIDKDSLQKFQEFERSDADTWTILSESELLKRKTSFSFIIIPNDDTAYNKLRPYTSNRLMKWIRGKANLENEEQSLKYIYQYYTGIGDNPVIPIHIWDELTHTSHGGKDSESIALYRNEHSFIELAEDQDNALIILSKNDLKFNKLKGEQFIYRKHHSNRNDFIAFFEKIKGIKNNNQNSQSDDNTKPPILKCVEAITGDNSSDRLVRREELDVFWYYKHLYAMKKKVAIIDERLFKYAHGIDESQLIFSNTVDERPQELTIDEVKNKVSDIDNDKLSVMIGFLDDPNEQKLNDVSDIDDLKKHGIETISLEILTKVFPNVFMAENTIPLNRKSNEGISHLTPYYAGKGVDVFTVIDDGENSMSLVGCTIHTGERKEKEFVFHNTFEKIAVFSRDEKSGKTLNVNFLNENFQHHYDYISIHQGILDKIYERLGIKDDDGKKCEITNCLYENMIRDNKAIGTYLPCLIIHSGRAKPNANDMPQKQPFLQYSAIENAVKDSKLILIELLDYAKYE